MVDSCIEDVGLGTRNVVFYGDEMMTNSCLNGDELKIPFNIMRIFTPIGENQGTTPPPCEYN